MTRFIPFLFSFFGSVIFLHSQAYYIKYDPVCLDRYEFVTDIDPNPYVVYTSRNTNGSLTQLDVGKENTNWLKTLPAKLTDCSAIRFDKAMALAINNSTVKIYVVKESQAQYNISLVEKATYFSSSSESLEVTMSDADFKLNWNNLVSNKNLGSPASLQEVFLEGTIKYQCLSGYIFRKKDAPQSASFKEYTILPEYGIINKRAVPYEGAITNSIRLDKVNGVNFLDFISKKCIERDAETAAYLSTIYEKDNSIPQGYDNETTKVATPIPDSYDLGPCKGPSKPGTHIVLKGETLYSISKRYGISVDQLKTWNEIGQNNLINLCQELVVNPNPTAAPSNTVSGVTATGVTPQSTGTSNQQFHIVKPSETVEQLAAMYGYTETRFRKMNSLGTYERVYAGQKLFTSDCDCPNTEGVSSDIPMPYDAVSERLTLKGNPDVYFKPIKVHEVKDNESLFAIAKLYDTTVDRINELNGLDKNSILMKGQRIYVQ